VLCDFDTEGKGEQFCEDEVVVVWFLVAGVGGSSAKVCKQNK